MQDLYIIEARDASGKLDFSAPQPEDVFGEGAITGITINDMAAAVFRALPDADLRGDQIGAWPKLVNGRFSARRKTW